MNKLVVAHRGATQRAHENTLSAFEAAVECGSDMVEFDVRRTGDGALVVHHDASVGGKLISALTLPEAFACARAAGFDLPTLEQVLLALRRRIWLDVELKEEGYEEEVVELILDHYPPDGFRVTSFCDASVARLRRFFPQVKTGLLLGVASPKWGAITRISELFPGGRQRRSQASFLAPHYRLLKFGFLERAEKMGMELFIWTVDDASLMDFLLRQRVVAGLITNRPDVALEVRSRISQAAVGAKGAH